ncbi:GumC family protein [Robbsia andropogonis]|uniref:GumC family protein n=1 Tax=Robbsia andropogonis TaxID=28092 RepID=UPI00209E362B|nr:GNVR domain-containing protein [Robbsia andropogonis]MCP1121490.1 hypothetical protein [Robbsia andropogonis]MCP1131320.1 hypothetical protein [Robbsia andropogonis]
MKNKLTEYKAISVRDQMSTTTESATLNIYEFLVIAGEQKRTLIGSVIITVVIGILVGLLLPPTYQAKSSLMPPQQTPGSSATLGGLGAAGALDSMIGIKTPDEMYVALLRSNVVADGLIERFHLKERYKEKYTSDVRKILQKEVRFTSDKKSGFISIEVKEKSAKFAAELANGYVDQLKDIVNKLAVTEAQRRRIFFARQINETKQKLDNAEEAFDFARRNSGILSLDGSVEETIRTVATLRANVADIDVQLRTMSAYATDSNPAVIQLKIKKNALQKQLDKLEFGNSDRSEKNDDQGLTNARLFREIKYQQAVLQQLNTQLNLAQVDEAREGPLVQQVDVAEIPQRKSFPRWSIVLPVSIIFGIVVGIFLIFSRNMWKTNIKMSGKGVALKAAWSLSKK